MVSVRYPCFLWQEKIVQTAAGRIFMAREGINKEGILFIGIDASQSINTVHAMGSSDYGMLKKRLYENPLSGSRERIGHLLLFLIIYVAA